MAEGLRLLEEMEHMLDGVVHEGEVTQEDADGLCDEGERGDLGEYYD